MARKFEDYLREAEKHYQEAMTAGCIDCGNKKGCKLDKMGFGDNFIITTPLDCVELYRGLLKTGEFKEYVNNDSYRGQFHLVHLNGCAHLGIARTGEEWYFAKSVGYETDIVFSPLAKSSALELGLSVSPILHRNSDHLCEAKSVFKAVNGVFRFAKKNRIPLIGGFEKFGGFPRGRVPPYSVPKLVYDPKK